MTLTTTPGDAAADSYATLAEANTYHTAMGNTAWTGTDALKEAAMRRATAWLDATFRARWPGIRTDGRDQALAWPRSDAADDEGNYIDADTIPIEVKNAQIEAALRELQSPGSLSPDVVRSERVVREKIGPLETEYADAGGVGGIVPVLTIVDGILSTLLGPTSRNTLTIERA